MPVDPQTALKAIKATSYILKFVNKLADYFRQERPAWASVLDGAQATVYYVTAQIIPWTSFMYGTRHDPVYGDMLRVSLRNLQFTDATVVRTAISQYRGSQVAPIIQVSDYEVQAGYAPHSMAAFGGSIPTVGSVPKGPDDPPSDTPEGLSLQRAYYDAGRHLGALFVLKHIAPYYPVRAFTAELQAERDRIRAFASGTGHWEPYYLFNRRMLVRWLSDLVRMHTAILALRQEVLDFNEWASQGLDSPEEVEHFWLHFLPDTTDELEADIVAGLMGEYGLPGNGDPRDVRGEGGMWYGPPSPGALKVADLWYDHYKRTGSKFPEQALLLYVALRPDMVKAWSYRWRDSLILRILLGEY